LPFRSKATHLQDILDGIDHIEGFLAGMDFEKYKSDLRTKSAVERQLQIVTEAAKRLGDMPNRSARGLTGLDFVEWEIFCGMAITRSMTR
jgi:uncharacterized protein with HEPN domain